MPEGLGPSPEHPDSGALSAAQLEKVQAFVQPLAVEGRDRSSEEVATTDQAVAEMKAMFADNTELDLADPKTFYDAYATLHAYVTYRQMFIDAGMTEEKALETFQRILANAAPSELR